MVERWFWEPDVAGSNPVSPTTLLLRLPIPAVFFLEGTKESCKLLEGDGPNIQDDALVAGEELNLGDNLFIIRPAKNEDNPWLLIELEIIPKPLATSLMLFLDSFNLDGVLESNLT